MKTVELYSLIKEALSGQNEAIAVAYHGKLLGYFYPVQHPQKDSADVLWGNLAKAVERVMAETGLEEEGIVELLVPKKAENL